MLRTAFRNEQITGVRGHMQMKTHLENKEITKKMPLRNMYFKSADDAFVNKELNRIKKERQKN